MVTIDEIGKNRTRQEVSSKNTFIGYKVPARSKVKPKLNFPLKCYNVAKLNFPLQHHVINYISQ